MDARKLLKSNSHEGYMILGMVAALRHKPNEIHEYFGKALQLYESDVVLINYALALKRVFEFSDAVKYAILSLEKFRSNQMVVGTCFDIFVGTAHLYEAYDVFNKNINLLAGKKTVAEELLNDFALFRSQENFSKEEFYCYIDSVAFIVRKYSLFDCTMNITIDQMTADESEKQWLCFEIRLQYAIAIEKLLDINDEMTERLIECPLSISKGRFTAIVTSESDGIV